MHRLVASLMSIKNVEGPRSPNVEIAKKSVEEVVLGAIFRRPYVCRYGPFAAGAPKTSSPRRCQLVVVDLQWYNFVG